MHVALVWKAKAGFKLKIPWHLTKFLTCWGLSKIHDDFLVRAPWERPAIGSPLLHSLWGIKNKLINTLTLSGKTAWFDPSLSWVQLGLHMLAASYVSRPIVWIRPRQGQGSDYHILTGLAYLSSTCVNILYLGFSDGLSSHSIRQAYLGMLHVQNTFVVLSTHFIICQQVKGLIVKWRTYKLAQMLHRCCTVADD